MKLANRFRKNLRYPLLGLTTGLLAFQISCSTTLPNARHKQFSDGVTGGRNFTMVATRSTIVAAIHQPVTTVKLGLAVLWNRPKELVSGNSPIAPNRYSALPDAPGSDEFETMLDQLHLPPAEMGKLTCFVDGEKFFPELDRQIANAKESIRLQVYIFDNDDIGVRYAELLKRRASELQVQVLFDDLGSTLAQYTAPQTPGPKGFQPPENMGAYLRENSKLHLRRTLNPWLISDHTKLMVFDREIAFVGGMNVGREYYSEWHDLMVRIEGPIVRSLANEFDHAWTKAGPFGDFTFSAKTKSLPHPKPVAGAIPLRLLRTDPANGRYEILDATLLAIRGARRRIWMETPYFAHDGIALAVEQAARRGVDVRLIIPSGENPNLMDAGNHSAARALIQAGANVYRYPKMTHLKAIICDDWANIGSANLDTLSMRINRELNLAFSDRAMIRTLERTVFQPGFRKSTRLTLKETEGLKNFLAEALADQL